MEWALVKKWADAGKLPTFRHVLEQGARTELASTAAQLPDTVWSVIYSGQNPGRIAKYFYVQYDPHSGDLRMMDDDAIGVVPFWQYLTEAGKRVCVLDLPKFPVSKVHGVSLANWGSHATKTARASHPPALLAEIRRRFGPHPVGECDAVDRTPQALLKLRHKILDGVKLRGELLRFLMAREDWDVFFAAFSETHCAGHHFWNFLDPTHPLHDPADRHGLRDTIESVYRAIDQELGEMLSVAGPDARVLIFSGHGIGPIWHASWNLQDILNRLGYGNSQPVPANRQPATRNPWRRLKMALPGSLQYAIKACLPKQVQNELLFRWYAGSRDWEGCRAIALPNNDSVGAIRILVRGRDRYGTVESSEEHARIRADIAAALKELHDPASGRKVVSKVTVTSEEFEGPFVDGLPDLTVLWDQSFVWEELASPRIGQLKIRTQDSRTGSHTPRGFLLALGYGETPGQELPAASLYDIAPTVLTAAGVDPPDVIEGRPLFPL